MFLYVGKYYTLIRLFNKAIEYIDAAIAYALSVPEE